MNFHTSRIYVHRNSLDVAFEVSHAQVHCGHWLLSGSWIRHDYGSGPLNLGWDKITVTPAQLENWSLRG